MAERKKILIVGGGSAGWITAALMAKTLNDRFSIELIESSEIGTIGVGEGTVPKIGTLFEALGISEGEWMPACHATYKTGIRFKGWSTRPGFESYFHGFYSHFDRDHVKALQFNSLLRRKKLDVHAHPDLFIYNSYLADRSLSPVPPESFPFDVQYAFHCDAGLLGEFLKDWSMKRGVSWRDCRVEKSEKTDDGDLAAVVTDKGERIEADLFIDCTGFGAFLIEKEMGAQHISYSDVLFNDAAVTMATPALDNPKTMTTATTMSNGWAWHIPLQSRTGNGYVYSSRYIDSEAAEAELREHLGADAEDIEARHLKMRIGRLDRPWIKNCIAVGLSQGFLEPLEATGLMLTQYTITRIVHHLLDNGGNDAARDAFNQEVGSSFDGVRDFIVAHYLTASRDDTQYWRDVRTNTQSISDNLKAVIEAWFRSDDLEAVLKQRGMSHTFSKNSWYYMFSGKGIYPPDGTEPAPEELVSKVPVDHISDMLERCTLNHQTQKERLLALAEGEFEPVDAPTPEEARAMIFDAMPKTFLNRTSFEADQL